MIDVNPQGSSGFKKLFPFSDSKTSCSLGKGQLHCIYKQLVLLFNAVTSKFVEISS